MHPKLAIAILIFGALCFVALIVGTVMRSNAKREMWFCVLCEHWHNALGERFHAPECVTTPDALMRCPECYEEASKDIRSIGVLRNVDFKINK